MTSDAKIGLVLGLVFILTVALIIRGVSSRVDPFPSTELQQSVPQLRAKVIRIIDRVRDPNTGEAITWLTPELQERIVEYIFRDAIQSSNARDQMQEAMNVQLGQIEDRIRSIETKFPDQTDVDKTNLFNNSLLVSRIDQLSKQVDQIQSQMLTRWDVALVCSGIMTGITSVVITTFALIRPTGKRKRRR